MKQEHSFGENLCIIPARGGSKGIPRKNIQLLCGKPLIGHTIEAALQSSTITRVVVSTDDAEIAQVSERFGAEVVWRPEDISGDWASSEDALLHAIEHLHTTEDYRPDLITFLQCTSPLTIAEDIDATVACLADSSVDSALAVVDFHYFLWNQGEDGTATGINHDKSRRLLRQEREAQYLETGAVYVMRTGPFLQEKGRFVGKTAIYHMPGERRLEIDEPVDFEVAEVLMRKRQQEQAASQLPAQIGAIIFDFDGVFTDNKVTVTQGGVESVVCNRSDGHGISLLRKRGVTMLVLSTETNPVVQARCDKLKLECLHGIEDKLTRLSRWLDERDILLENVVYIGNDVNDLDCLRAVGCSVAVNDAYPQAKSAAKIILSSDGGQGAVRELADLVIQRLAKEDARSV